MQVCGNLLSNAVKFTQSGNVSFRMEYNGSVLSIVVEDTGNGMSGEEQQRVFGAFERLSNAATQDGFGLGLSIVKRIVDMLDGTIRLDSEKGKGSRFTIELPMQTADIAGIEKKKMQEQYQEPYFERSYSFIMLDDNDILLSMARDMYAHYGIHCEICNNTGDLMEAIRTNDYDLLITDLKMPETNGYTTVEFELPPVELALIRPVSCTPFVPQDAATRAERCELILRIQAEGLAKRMEHTHAKCGVLGISGGLDSCLALLVAVRACKVLCRDAKDIVALLRHDEAHPLQRRDSVRGFGRDVRRDQHHRDRQEPLCGHRPARRQVRCHV